MTTGPFPGSRDHDLGPVTWRTAREVADGHSAAQSAGPDPQQSDEDTDDRAARIASLARRIAAVQNTEGKAPNVEASSRPWLGRGAPSTTLTEASVTGPPDIEPRPGTPGSGPGAWDDQVAAARAICLRLLAVAPRPRAGLAQALKRREIPDDIATAVLDRLTEVSLIDDVAYARSFVRIKHRDRALGRGALRTELRKLGVDEEVLAVAVETVDSTAEHSRATEFIARRLDAALAAGPIAARRRLLGLLARRGYGAEVSAQVVEQALAGYSDDA